MDDIEKIIKAWERCRECRSLPVGMSEAWVECEYTIGLYCAQDKLVGETIKLLKSIQAPRLMTLEEIQKADYVWLEVDWQYTKDHKPYLNIALPVPYEDENNEDMILFRVKADIDNAGHTCSQYYHGIVWRCWTAKPTQEQMNGTEWETKEWTGR